MKKRHSLSRLVYMAVLPAALLLCGCGSKTIVVERGPDDTQPAIQAQTQDAEPEQESAHEVLVTVYVCGAVNVPGVYALPEGARVYEAIALAGGLTEDADETCVNQAGVLSDAQMLRILTQEERALGGVSTGVMEAGSDSADRINLNTADRQMLMTLPGIGAAKAEAILAYRQEHGRFTAIEEIMQISGIKQAVFEQIRDRICV